MLINLRRLNVSDMHIHSSSKWYLY